jgi:hypothetical protein
VRRSDRPKDPRINLLRCRLTDERRSWSPDSILCQAGPRLDGVILESE